MTENYDDLDPVLFTRRIALIGPIGGGHSAGDASHPGGVLRPFAGVLDPRVGSGHGPSPTLSYLAIRPIVAPALARTRERGGRIPSHDTGERRELTVRRLLRERGPSEPGRGRSAGGRAGPSTSRGVRSLESVGESLSSDGSTAANPATWLPRAGPPGEAVPGGPAFGSTDPMTYLRDVRGADPAARDRTAAPRRSLAERSPDGRSGPDDGDRGGPEPAPERGGRDPSGGANTRPPATATDPRGSADRPGTDPDRFRPLPDSAGSSGPSERSLRRSPTVLREVTVRRERFPTGFQSADLTVLRGQWAPGGTGEMARPGRGNAGGGSAVEPAGMTVSGRGGGASGGIDSGGWPADRARTRPDMQVHSRGVASVQLSNAPSRAAPGARSRIPLGARIGEAPGDVGRSDAANAGPFERAPPMTYASEPHRRRAEAVDDRTATRTTRRDRARDAVPLGDAGTNDGRRRSRTSPDDLDVDVGRLADQLYRRFERKLRIERERRGL